MTSKTGRPAVPLGSASSLKRTCSSSPRRQAQTLWVASLCCSLISSKMAQACSSSLMGTTWAMNSDFRMVRLLVVLLVTTRYFPISTISPKLSVARLAPREQKADHRQFLIYAHGAGVELDQASLL